MAVGGMREYIIIEHAQNLEREIQDLKREYDNARQQECIHYDNFSSMQDERNQWRECAERLAEELRGYESLAFTHRHIYHGKGALRDFDRLKEASK